MSKEQEPLGMFQKQKEGHDWVFYAACALIAMMFALPVLMLIDYLLQEAYAPTTRRSGGCCSHWGGINKHYRLARGR